MATRPKRQPVNKALKHWNGLLYADPGAGKTVFGGSDNKVLFIAPENDGLMSAATMGSTAERIEVKTYEDVVNTYEWYDEHPDELKDFNVIVIDSITELQYLVRNYVLAETADEKRRKNQDPDRLQIQDYGTMHELLELMVRGFNDLPINVLWTATAKKVEDADKNQFLVPDLQGKKDYGVAMKIAALMTFYGYLRVEDAEVLSPTEDDAQAVKVVRRRVYYWEDTGTIRGKDRTNALKPFTINSTLQQVRLAIAGKLVRNPETGKLTKPTGGEAHIPPPPVKQPEQQPKKDEPQASPQPENPVDSTPSESVPDTPKDKEPEDNSEKTTVTEAIEASQGENGELVDTEAEVVEA